MAEVNPNNHRHRYIHRHRTSDLPPDVILNHILPKLPAKSAIRFKTVCKQWRSFLNTPTFYDLHNHHVTNNRHQNDDKLLLLSTTKPCQFYSIDCESLHQGFTILPSPFEVYDPQTVSVLTTCHGMILIGLKKNRRGYEYTNLVLWNPCTSEYKTLSETNCGYTCYIATDDGFKMYYSCYEDDYRILRVTQSYNAYIYSLKSDSWRNIHSDSSDSLMACCSLYWNFNRWMPSVLLDDEVYFLSQCDDDDEVHEDNEDVWIIRFDTNTEKFKKITNVGDLIFRKRKPACWRFWRFSVESGCIQLHLWNNQDRRIHLFRMKRDGDWMKVETNLPKRFNYHLKPLHLMRDGSWLMHFESYLYNVDMEGYINGDEFEPLNAIKMGIAERGKYSETFVSPNRYMEGVGCHLYTRGTRMNWSQGTADVLRFKYYFFFNDKYIILLL